MKRQIALFDLGLDGAIFADPVRDGGSEPWRFLRDNFSKFGYELVTYDQADKSRLVHEIHLELKKGFGFPASLVSIEPPQILPINYSPVAVLRYERIFS